MLLIAVSYRRCGRNLRATLDTVINSLSANHAYLKTLYMQARSWLRSAIYVSGGAVVIDFAQPVTGRYRLHDHTSR